jgi:hypothetical protein
MRTSLKFALVFAGSVPVRPLPDRWRTFRLARFQRQGGTDPRLVITYAELHGIGTLVRQLRADEIPSKARVVRLLALQIVEGREALRQFATAATVWIVSTVKSSDGSSPVNMLFETSRNPKFFSRDTF